MAEFCLDCWNKINETSDSSDKYILSKDLDLCEECGRWTHIIIMERQYYYRHKFRLIIFPFKVIYRILYFLWKIFILPYSFYNNRKQKKTIIKK